MSTKYILAIDQGTSSTKSLIFDANGVALAKGSEPLQTNYLENGWVEQDPEAIWQNVLASVSLCLQDFQQKGYAVSDIATIGISNQRETFLIWDQEGKPLYNAIVWQCKRSVEICASLQLKGLTELVSDKTGLVIDPYFSATKLIWLYQHHETVREAIQNGNAFFGTVDTWLLYKLTGGASYATDHTNASRTMLFNLKELQLDHELIAIFGLKGLHFPQIKSSSDVFGYSTIGDLLGNAIPIHGMIGDSHAAAFGEGCFDAGTAKATLGTGCSILMNIGEKPVRSSNGMVSTICWSVNGRVDYALEGVIVSCGATIEWLKQELNLFKDSKETAAMAAAVADNGGVYLVPAFSGLGSPHWQMNRRASITGLSFGTGKNHIVRAALESIPYQIKDVLTAMEKDASIVLSTVTTDGGISANEFVMQFMSDVLDKTVLATEMPDVSALGAAYMAGLGAGIFASVDSLKTLPRASRWYQPGSETVLAATAYEGWQKEIGKPVNFK